MIPKVSYERLNGYRKHLLERVQKKPFFLFFPQKQHENDGI